MRRPTVRRIVPSVVSMLALAMGVSACGDDKSYAVPDRLCGVSVEPALLKPLLPAGEELKAEPRYVGDDEFPGSEGALRCMVTVDGKNALYVQEFSGQNSFDVLEHARKSFFDRNPQKIKGVANAVVADGKFLAVTPCGNGKKNHLLDIDMNMPAGEAGDLRDELERFATAYLPVGKKKMGCEQ